MFEESWGAMKRLKFDYNSESGCVVQRCFTVMPPAAAVAATIPPVAPITSTSVGFTPWERAYNSHVDNLHCNIVAEYDGRDEVTLAQRRRSDESSRSVIINQQLPAAVKPSIHPPHQKKSTSFAASLRL
jgi:hypothetical protein